MLHFRSAYLHAMRDQAPAIFRELRKTGAMDAHLEMKAQEAGRLFRDLLGDQTGLQAEREATEHVYATLITFPPSDNES